MLVNIGFGNTVHSDKIMAVVSPSAAPIKRLVSTAREAGHVVDATQGRKTKAVIIMDNDRVVLSALQPETISKRFNGSSSYTAYSGKEPDEEMSE